MKNYKELMAFVKEHDVKFIDFRFTDLYGLWHHISFPVKAVTENLLEEGIYFDGSSIAGWRAVHESDMILKADFNCVMLDPFSSQTTAVVVCDVYDPVTNTPYDRDPRSIAKRAESYLKSTGIADKAYFGPEAEFFVFDGIRFDVSGSGSFYEISADEFPESSGKPIEEGNHGHRPLAKGGYFPVSPLDSLSDLRAEMVTVMEEMGVAIEKHHHEVAPGQHEIGFEFGTMVSTADALQIYKYVVKNVAHSYGKTATFMPKPIYGDNGSGMHVHQSLWKGNTPLFAGSAYSGLSQEALYYIGGILKHAKALNAFTNPTTNSYKRLIPGFEAPVILAYSARNRSAACRIPLSHGEKSKRVEVRFPDPTANGYLAFAAMMMAGLDGIQNKIHPGEAMEHNLFEEVEIARRLPTVSGSLRQALESLQENHAFLTAGGVFSEDFLQAFCALKWSEVHAFEHSPHPIEFKLYYSA
jgi:glutamine synthetase